MKKKLNVIISTVLALTLALSGVSYVSLKNTEADTVAALKTIKFDDESDIVAKNDSAAAIADDAERGKVISLGAGDITKELTGAQISNPWADAAVNPDGAKEYTAVDVQNAFNYALGLPYGTAFRSTAEDPGKGSMPEGETQYLHRAEGAGGVTWRSLTVSTAAKNNGAVQDSLLNDSSTGNYLGAENAQKVMGDTYAASRIKRDGKEVICDDGEKAAVSAYKPEKEADYVRPIWDKEDGLTMSVWVKAPEGTTADTVLFSFFNDRIVGAFDAETLTTFNNVTGHFTVKADGSVEFAELSDYAGNPSEASGGNAIGRYAASRNRYETKAIGTKEGVNVFSNPGEWVCVTLVVENDYVSVYFDGIQVNYIESLVPSGETDDGKFTQDWDNPENSPSWTRTEIETDVKTFNGWFCSRHTPTYALVNSGIYSSFPSWTSRSARKMQPYPVAGCEGGSTLSSRPRITLCQWLQDSATTLYLGGAANKDLSEGIYDEATFTTTFVCEKQYGFVEGTMFDDIEFYGEALTSSEVATAYVNAGGKLEATPEPTESIEPTPTESVEPTPTESVEPTPTESVEPTPTESVEPTPTETVEPTPTETVEPTPSETTTPEPTETATPEPSETVVPDYTIGDVNDDGKVDAADALLVLKHAAKIDISAETFIEEAAHTNSDTSIDAQDALNILKLAARIIETLPVE